jgi:hypothetical protein
VNIPYRCERLHNGQPVTVVLAALAVPRCGHCGELVFDYAAEEQINQAFHEQTSALSANTSTMNGTPPRGEEQADEKQRRA